MTNKTLRDEIAMAALTGLLASDVIMRELDESSKEMEMTGKEEEYVHPKVIASRCYLIADAMLAARGEDKPKDDGWIEWNGGECPVNVLKIVDVKTRAGKVLTCRAKDIAWEHWGVSSDIIAYRTTEAI